MSRRFVVVLLVYVGVTAVAMAAVRELSPATAWFWQLLVWVGAFLLGLVDGRPSRLVYPFYRRWKLHRMGPALARQAVWMQDAIRLIASVDFEAARRLVFNIDRRLAQGDRDPHPFDRVVDVTDMVNAELERVRDSLGPDR